MFKPNEPRSAGNLPPSTPYEEHSPGRTRQEDKAAADINHIMAKYERTGLLPVTNREAFFADVSNAPDYRTAIERVHAVEDAFMQLPAKVRARFNNDPSSFLDFTADPANRDEMVKMGLIEGPDIDTEQEAADAQRQASTASNQTAETPPDA